MNFEIAKHLNDAKATFSFCFDDGCYLESTKKVVACFHQVAQKTGVFLKATSALTVNFISPTLYEFWKEAYRDGWFDFCAHSMTHCLCYNEETPIEVRENDAKETKEHLEKMFNVPILTYAIPGGGSTEKGREILRSYYYGVRAGSDAIDDPDTMDFYNLHVLTGLLKYETQDYIDAIDRLIAEGGTFVQVDHWISENPDDKFFVQKEHTFLPECEYLAEQVKNGNLAVLSMNDAFCYFIERRNAEIVVLEENEKEVRLQVQVNLPKDLFTFPLTLLCNGTPVNVLPNEILTIQK